MKKFLKTIGAVSVIVVTAYSIYHLIRLIKKYDVLSLLYGFDLLHRGHEGIIDISRKGVKFISRKSEENLDAFSEYLKANGYRLVGRFGRSDLYDYQGVEVIVKQSMLFNKYYLFEVYNESFFEAELSA
ncbi:MULTISPECIES: hypothetical protein [unclassified Fusibacter]|uniref:hypothetical protein n=1 Tax=unclassified Fusibacter TaxID=2624464 RepID=UPI0010122456|nr:MULTISPECIES: hypothetical protein [unclassified Fusibacter]MCK8061292.1 hypothetical protein [Fusibacter sp. A2]NPE23511.1 hypothetical protein [Fusibacter sp. A1]RXV59115.1 hypothetical protein DWB64_16970 [Fusibacter sp. A1]